MYKMSVSYELLYGISYFIVHIVILSICHTTRFGLFWCKIFIEKYFLILSICFALKYFQLIKSTQTNLCKTFTLKILVKYLQFLSNSHPTTFRLTSVSLSIFFPSQPKPSLPKPSGATHWPAQPNSGATHRLEPLTDRCYQPAAPPFRHQCSRRECRAQGRYRSTTTTSFVVQIGDKVDSGVGRRWWVSVTTQIHWTWI